MAMLAMLPDWDSISSTEGGVIGSTVLTQINNVVHCMGKQYVENGTYTLDRILIGFDVYEVSISRMRYFF